MFTYLLTYIPHFIAQYDFSRGGGGGGGGGRDGRVDEIRFG